MITRTSKLLSVNVFFHWHLPFTFLQGIYRCYVISCQRVLLQPWANLSSAGKNTYSAQPAFLGNRVAFFRNATYRPAHEGAKKKGGRRRPPRDILEPLVCETHITHILHIW